MSQTDLSAVRAKAWKTRREKYGPCGHNGYGARIRKTDRPLRPIVEVSPEIECEEGYPTDESLDAFRAVQLSPTVGLWATLSATQREALLKYSGCETHGDSEPR